MVLGIVGAFGDTNFGDYAMLVNNIYSIQPSESIVFTYNETLLDVLSKTYLKDYTVFPIIVKTAYAYEAAYGNSYNVQYDDDVLVPIEVLRYISNEQQVREAVCRIDVLFICGGGYFNRVWNAKHRKGKLLSILGTMIIAMEEHKKIVFGGNTFGPFDASSEFYKSILLPLQDAVYAVRDDVYSVANLRQLGIEDKVTLLPDDLYFMHDRFSVYKPDIRVALPERYIVLELYCSLDELKRDYDEIKTFVQQIKQKYGLKTVFISLDKGFGGEEQGRNLETIQELTVWHFGGELFRKVEDVLYLVRHAQFVVCQRYHLFLLAIANNVPAYQMLKNVCGDKRYYYAKSGGMLKQVFQNQIYKERCFLADDIVKGLHEITMHYEDLIYGQKSLFNHKKEKAEAHMRQIRMEYIHEYLKN